MSNYYYYEDEEPFCCVMWLKIVFLSGFALSQFSVGSIVQKFGSWTTLRFAAKTLIISGMIASNAGKFYFHPVELFIVVNNNLKTQGKRLQSQKLVLVKTHNFCLILMKLC